ncbi:hypothetical protein [Nocardioides sp. B-3]|uniref:hypothetical protein n=1 Tax=Nocardioides sp. B-3 TaxID=2895565 RepID=UPI00215290C9|nr:hypothetical protein [Nocardioides sp. B-3]UUZ59465.1 hypothetical protein LP418_27410 [Nocardioides sp. B-3]
MSRYLPDDVAPARHLHAVIDALGDLDRARAAFARVSDEALEDLLERLLPVSETADPSVAPSAVEVLIEQFPRLRVGRGRGMDDFGAEFAVTRPVLRLLRRMAPDDVMALTQRLIDMTPTLYGAFELATIVGHRENAGSKIVPAEDAIAIEEQLKRRLRATGPAELASERSLVRLLFHTLLPPEDADSLCLPALADARVTAALLRDAVAEAHSSALDGTGSTKVAYSLHWDVLVRMYGSEAAVYANAADVRGIDDAKIREDPRLQLALSLVEKYRGGWRPGEFGGLLDDWR